MKRSQYTKEEKIRIVRDYLDNDLSAREMQDKYGLKNYHAIAIWKFRYLKEAENLPESEKSSNFAPVIPAAPEQDEETTMGKQRTPQELEVEIKRLEKELEMERLRTKALTLMIDIAERNGMPVRKKTGAKR